jgi:hypothetical protein
MTDELRRYREIEELTVEEHAERLQARNRNEPEPRFETTEHREAKAEALRDAGLDDEAREYEASGEKSPSDLTVEDHFQRIRRNR